MPTVTDSPPAVAGLATAVSTLSEVALDRVSDDELLDLLRTLEGAKRRLEAIEHRVIAQVESRNLPGRYVIRSTGLLLSGLLKLSPSEAARRVRRARELGPRVMLSGETLPPLLPIAAGVHAAGEISRQHTDVIATALRSLHERLPADTVADAEAFLVEQATAFNPQQLQGIARRLVDTLDPDGVLADEREQRRRRTLSLTPIGNGMCRISGELDSTTTALAQTVLHSLGAPRTTDGERDERTGGQRLHDALAAVFKLALRVGELPAAGGIPATVLITMTAEQFESGTGHAVTSFGELLRVPEALRLIGEASVGWVVPDSRGAILNHGRKNRIASRSQTLALIARDHGCTFPGCTDPPEWTERHHIVPWRQGGSTDLDNLTLLCDFHHDRIDTEGWHIVMREGLPYYLPPPWVDPEQRPMRNVRP